MNNRIRNLLVGALLAACIHNPAAAARLYDVEIIIFRHDRQADQDEAWHTPDSTAGRASGQFREGRFTELSASRYRLNPVRYSLQRSDGYSVLFHRAWRQVAYGPSQAADYPVHSFSDDRRNSVEGTVRLERNRYLHLDVDLLLMNAADAAPGQYSGEPGSTPAFRLREKRRIKSSELHYFDHPRFGLLAVVTPYAAPQKSEPPAEAAPAPAPDTDSSPAASDTAPAEPQSP